MPSIPFVQQMEAVECGAACLTMALRHFGHHAELAEVRERCGVSRDGVSAKQVVRVAREYDLVPKARRIEPEDLAEVTAPAILHWEMNHFVLFRAYEGGDVLILDPAVGPRRIAEADFDRSFTGICIELSPGDDFEKKKPSRRSARRYAELLGEVQGPIGVILGTSVLLNLLGLAVPLCTQLIIDEVILDAQRAWLPIIGVAALGLLALTLSSLLLRAWVVGQLRRFVDRRLGRDVVEQLASLPMRYFGQRHSADLMGRVGSVKVLREVLAERSVSLLIDAPLLVTYLAVLFIYSPPLAGVILALALAYLAVYAATRPRQQAAFRERTVKDVKASVQLLQTLQGVLTLKSSGRELAAHEGWLRMFVGALNAGVQEARLRLQADALLLFLRLLAPTVTLLWGATLVVRGDLTIGELLGFSLVAAAFLTPLESAVQTLLRVLELPVHLARLDDVLAAEPEPTGEHPAPRLEGAVRFEGVTFRYGPTSPPVLDDLSFSVQPGEKVALVGPSGSGKSTVARLLLGLFTPESGTISFDGHDLGELELDSVRRQIGTVLQETTLFEGTIRENIALYHPTASREDVVAAARVAQLHADIDRLPLGYETPIDNDGGPLSGGQRQRLALARAVLHRPSIMVLDEATSALDAVTEEAVENYLTTRACTRIVIAHRLSTVRDADRILVLSNGRLVEQGPHDVLLAKDGIYASLARHGERKRSDEAAPSSPGQEVTAARLGELPVLDELDETTRESLAAVMARRRLDRGAALMTQGDRAPGLYWLVSGGLEVVLQEPGLPELVVGQVTGKSVIGEASLLDGSPVSATLRATEPVEVLHLPAQDYEALRSTGDIAATELTLALGKLVALRIRDKTKEREAIGRGTKLERSDEGDTSRGLPLSATGLGASLTPGELEQLEQLGETRRLSPGDSLFAQGDEGDRFFVVLTGRLGVVVEEVDGYLNTIKAGELLGEVGLFHPGPRTAGCVALSPTVVFGVPHEALRRLLRQGRPVATKVLRHLTHSLVRVFRISDLRLREAIALENGEEENAFAAREEARALHDARDLQHSVDEAIPWVPSDDAATSAASCLCAVLRAEGRAAPLVSVTEACSEHGEITPASLVRGARSFGHQVRRLALDAKDLRFIDAPLIVALKEGHHVLAYRWRAGALLVMDPRSGHGRLSLRELEAQFEGDAFEVEPASDFDETGSLAARILPLLRQRGGSVAGMVLASLGLQVLALSVPMGLSALIGQAIPSDDRGLIVVVGVALSAALLGQLALWIYRSRALLYLRTFLDRALLDQLMRHVLSLRIEFFEATRPASILQRFESFRLLRELLGNQGLSALLDLPMLAVALVFMLALDPALFAVPVAASLVCLVGLLVTLPKLRAWSADELTYSERQRGRLLEALVGMVTLRVVGARRRAIERWLPAASDELSANVRQDLWQSGTLALLSVLRLGAVAVATWWGAARVLSGDLSLGRLMAFTAVAGAFMLGLETVAGHAIALARATTRMALVRETFAEPPEQRALDKVQPGRLRGRIEVEGLRFAYGDEGPLVLDDIGLEVEPGSKVALVGSSGSGKSTLGKLLLGLYVPRTGRVLFDGRDLSSVDLMELRGQVGVVLQDSFLFAGSIRQNIAINAPDAPLEDIVEAAKAADIHDTIVALPMGYETVVSEGGSTFSGGQRQRLAIARALVHQPKILLLDEATSALDNLSQARLEQNLNQLQCTRVVIAHRLSTVIDADAIVVLERGRVVEQGTHDELMARKGPYHRLAAAQLTS